MTFAIRAENLGKCYQIGHQKKEAYSTLRDSIAGSMKGFLHKIRHPSASIATETMEDFWALKDVSFEIQPGDRVGIIGRNGAGKSTLLKILSRITEPTTGRFTTRGRVASLLEVGTGFHPELTGRENIYLNGAILGMTKADVRKHFDAIVDFSGVEKFLDTPVKRYSSGMYVRLAFAVAAHLDPDILIVDEVLAVGDAEFQKKCLGKMEEAGKEGRTVVFVSHNMGAVTRLCDRGVLIHEGLILSSTDIDLAISNYNEICRKRIEYGQICFTSRQGLGNHRVIDVKLNDTAFNAKNNLVQLIITSKGIPGELIQDGASIWDKSETHLISEKSDFKLVDEKGNLRIVAQFVNLPLVEGKYSVNISLFSQRGIEDYITNTSQFEILMVNQISVHAPHPDWAKIYTECAWSSL